MGSGIAGYGIFDNAFAARKNEAQAFENDGDYWRWKDPQTLPQGLSSRPLFTMGKKASISFGIVIAHHSVPLAIALEQLWAAESDGAKKASLTNGRSQGCGASAGAVWQRQSATGDGQVWRQGRVSNQGETWDVCTVAIAAAILRFNTARTGSV